MLTGLVVFHVIVCILLTLVVLLQFGKGAEAGAMMGGTTGSSQNIFASSSRGNFFTKLTTVLAILFMANSIALTIVKSKDSSESIFDDEAPIAAPLNSDQLTDEVKAEPAEPAATEKTEAKATPETTEAKAEKAEKADTPKK